MTRASAKQRNLRFQSLEPRYAFSATPLANGEEVRREVGQEDPFDEFYFDAQANDQVWVSVGEERAKTGNTVQLEVVTPSGQVYRDYDDNSALEVFQAPETGRYRVFVSERGNEQDFDYVIRLLVQPEALDRTYVQDSFLEAGERFGATLDFGKLSAVQFEANAGTTVSATLGKTAGTGYARMWIVGPDGTTEVNATNYTGINASFEPNVTGTYTAIIGESGGDERISYTFSVAALPSVLDYSLPENTYLQSGERHTGSFGVGEQHLVQFHAQAGGQVYATLGKTVEQAGYAKIRIVDPSGNEVPSTSISDYYGLQVGFDAPQSGLYTAVITESGSDQPLDYTFSVATLPGAVDYTLEQNAYLLSGQRHTGSIAVGEQHLVQFHAAAGGQVYATLGEIASRAGYSQIRVVDPSGTVVPSTSQTNSAGLQVSFDAPQSGLYTAVITESGSDQPLDYTFSVAALPGAVDYGLIQNAYVNNGDVRTASIAVGEQHLVQFNAVAGGQVYATLGKNASQGGYARITIVDPSGNVVPSTSTTDYYGLQVEFDAPQTGLYTAVITESGSDAPLDYTFSMSTFSPATSSHPWSDNMLADGAGQSGQLGFGEHSVHPFYLKDGDTASLSVTDTAGTSAYVRLQIFNGAGRRIWSGTDYTVETASITASNSGYYYAVVSESGADSALAYSISATGLSTPPPANGADFDGNTTIDGRDLALWQGGFGANAQGDADGDGDTDGSDFLSWQRSVRSSAGLAAVASVVAPEELGSPMPATLADVEPMTTEPARIVVAPIVDADLADAAPSSMSPLALSVPSEEEATEGELLATEAALLEVLPETSRPSAEKYAAESVPATEILIEEHGQDEFDESAYDRAFELLDGLAIQF